MKKPFPRSEELLARVKEALTPVRLPLLIVIDGAMALENLILHHGWRGNLGCPLCSWTCI
jgi:hypothetical protein